MNDLIRRQEAIEILQEAIDSYPPTMKGQGQARDNTLEEAIDLIKSIPIVEPKMGKWIKNEHGLNCCSICGKRPLQICYYNIYLDGYDSKDILSKYCPECGTEME